MHSSLQKIAVFPIPNCVCFPGTIFPLHVFEPRYRQMVNYCLENNLALAITHTKKVISEVKAEQTRAEALQSNQSTYQPFTVFSAGRCELLETLDDGRLILQVHLDKRYRLVEVEQRIPFILAHCEHFPDEVQDAVGQHTLEQLREKILSRLRVMTVQIDQLQRLLTSAELKTQDIDVFSFTIFNLLQFNPDQQQAILEMPSAYERLDYLLNILNQKVI